MLPSAGGGVAGKLSGKMGMAEETAVPFVEQMFRKTIDKQMF